jgi:hypothetical protein
MMGFDLRGVCTSSREAITHHTIGEKLHSGSAEAWWQAALAPATTV